MNLNLRRVIGKILDSSCYVVVVASHRRPELLGTDIPRTHIRLAFGSYGVYPVSAWILVSVLRCMV